MQTTQTLVLTGGPSGGKTTLAQTIQKEYKAHVTLVPEAASILFGGGWPRRKNELGVQRQQRAIYFLQRELEGLLIDESRTTLVVCDRGSLDGIAYWPTGERSSEFLKAVGSSMAEEIARYDWVIHLDTAPRDDYDTTNPLRNESYDEAFEVNERIKEAWSHHPRRIIIENNSGGHFFEKLQRALVVIESIIEGRSYAEISSALISDP
jgi:predicted ATPase